MSTRATSFTTLHSVIPALETRPGRWEDEPPFSFACPQCRAGLEAAQPDELGCPADGLAFQCVDGIWHLMAPEREAYFQPFTREYDVVRQAEGRGSEDPRYYRALPFEDLTGRRADDWRIRARSFQTLIDRIVLPLEDTRRQPLKILDIGAGNGWLSYRLAERGHLVAAVDIRTDALDGLGAHVHYDTTFIPIQAEYDRLPFAEQQADLIIFNASIHYSTDYLTTLREALRVLRRDGHLAIIDSPVYRDPASGAAMVRERERQFVQQFGFPSDTIPSENYLTFDRLEELAGALGLQWRMHQPYYGLAWAARPWKAKIRRHREPARFFVIDGRRAITDTTRPKRLRRAAARRLLRLRYHLTQRHRYNRLVLESVAGRSVLVLPQVFNPKLFRTGEFLAGRLDERLIPPRSTVLDMGSGSGLCGIVAATWASRVVAVDINPEAARCTRINAMLNGVEDKLEVCEGNLFAPIESDRFDIVLFNPPYFRGNPRDALDHAWRSDDTVERFAAELSDHLAAQGYALVVLSSDGDSQAFLDAFRSNGLDVTTVARRELINETLTIYRLSAKE